jgi:hypothetical protein
LDVALVAVPAVTTVETLVVRGNVVMVRVVGLRKFALVARSAAKPAKCVALPVVLPMKVAAAGNVVQQAKQTATALAEIHKTTTITVVVVASSVPVAKLARTDSASVLLVKPTVVGLA